jgi:hypothetical protein
MLFLVACGGPETNVQKAYPNAVVSPTALAFEDVPIHTTQALEIQVINGGIAALEVDSLAFSSTQGAVWSSADTSLSIPSGETVPLAVSFSPEEYLDYADTLMLHTNDPEHEELVVALTGTGVPEPVPDIAVDSLSLDFGTVQSGATTTKTLTIENEGDATLTISEMSQEGGGTFLVQGDPVGTLPAGQTTLLAISYSPVNGDGDHGGITLTSDDPDEPAVSVAFVGNGGGDFEYPVAVIDCPGQTEPRQTLELDGSGSYDPQNYTPLTYAWSIAEAPDGSASALVNETTDTTYLTTDIAGDYTVQLSVTNSIGLTGAPATCTIPTIPTEQLHVELIWSTPNADMDLHLLNGDGELYINPDDCNWCNQSPSWGESGGDDDPSLDIDDRSGYGPENINIDDPVDDTYTVVVHYYEDLGDDAVVATVSIWLYGELYDTYYETLYRNEVWWVGDILWPDALINVDGVIDEKPGYRSCQ